MRPPVRLGLPLVVSVWLVAMAGCNDPAAVAGASDPPLQADDFSRPWVVLDRVGSGKAIDAVAGGPGGYVAITHIPVDGRLVARKNIAAASADGVSWSEQLIVPDGFYHSIAHGAGLFVAVGGAIADSGGPGAVIVSTDGRAWRSVAQSDVVLRRVRYTRSGFVAVGQGSVAMLSPDGMTWRQAVLADSPPAAFFRDVDFGAGRFVAVGFTLHTSADGQSWAPVGCGPQLPCLSVTDPSGNTHGVLDLSASVFGNGVFLTSGTAGLLRSTDGLGWTRLGDGRDDRLLFTGGQFVELRSDAPQQPVTTGFTVSTSTDGAAWQVRTTATRVPSDATCATHRCLVFPSAILLIP